MSFGHLPARPIAAGDGKTWRLGRVLRRAERVLPSPDGDGLLLRLPDDWWEVADPDAELAERVEALLLKGASDERIAKQLAITPTRLARLRDRVRKQVTRSELARIRAVTDPPPARGRGNLRVGRG